MKTAYEFIRSYPGKIGHLNDNDIIMLMKAYAEQEREKAFEATGEWNIIAQQENGVGMLIGERPKYKNFQEYKQKNPLL